MTNAVKPIDKHLNSLMREKIQWRRHDGDIPYIAQLHGMTLTLRLNDFPEEPLYTLFGDGDSIANLDEWPSAWTRPEIESGFDTGRALKESQQDIARQMLKFLRPDQVASIAGPRALRPEEVVAVPMRRR